jgi:hypothetical protein
MSFGVHQKELKPSLLFLPKSGEASYKLRFKIIQYWRNPETSKLGIDQG